MNTRGIAEGMMVRDPEGKKLGSVIECRADSFLVEKGLFFRKDYEIAYDDVESVGDGEIRIRFAAGELEQRGAPRAQGEAASAGRGATATGAEAARDLGAAGAGMGGEVREEVRVPLAAEELEAQKRERQAGEVRVTKDVVTEEKQVNVPVTREEVHVERVPVQGAPPADEAAFQEKTIAVPVREEEVEIRKRPVVREEVRVGKVRRESEQRASAEVRHEEARIDREGEPGTPREEPEK